MKSRALLTVVLSAAVMVGATGCSTEGDAGNATNTLGIVQFSASDVTVNAVVKAAQAAAEADGWSVNIIDAQGSTDKANSAIQNLVTADVAAILVTVFDSGALSTGLQAAVDAGIPVVSHGGGEGDGVDVVFNVDAGAAIADRMIDDLGNKGEVLALTFKAGLPCLQRESALDAAIEGTDIVVTKQEIDVTKATNSGFDATTAWIANHPSGARAVWGCYDDPALGGVSALKQQGVEGVFVYGFNNAPDAQTAIENGAMTASVWFDSGAAGAAEFAAAKELATGGSPKALDDVPSMVIDKSNLKQWQSEHPDGF